MTDVLDDLDSDSELLPQHPYSVSSKTSCSPKKKAGVPDKSKTQTKVGWSSILGKRPIDASATELVNYFSKRDNGSIEPDRKKRKKSLKSLRKRINGVAQNSRIMKTAPQKKERAELVGGKRKRQQESKSSFSERMQKSQIGILPISQVGEKTNDLDLTALTVSTARRERRRANRQKQKQRTKSSENRDMGAMGQGEASASRFHSLIDSEDMKDVPSETAETHMKIYDIKSLINIFDVKVNGHGLSSQAVMGPVVNPVSDLLREKVNQLFIPTEGSQADDSARTAVDIKLRRRTLPEFSSFFESVLLQEAGRFPHPFKKGAWIQYPACMMSKNNRCVCQVHRLRGSPTEGFVLMAFMFRHELNRFLDSGVPPRGERPCVLCYRASVTSYVLTLRANWDTVKRIDDGFVCHPVQNLVDTKGGYLSQDVIRPTMDKWEGLVGPIAFFNAGKLRVVRDSKQNGRLRVDQQAIVFRADNDPKPRMGETVSDFRKRAAREVCRDHTGNTPLSLAQSAKQWQEFLNLESIVLRAMETSNEATTTEDVDQGRFESSDAIRQDSFRESDSTGRAQVVWAARVILLNERLKDVPHGSLNFGPAYWDRTQFPLIIHRLHECCFWQTSRQSNDTLVHVLSKVIPQPCQTRKFSDLLKGMFQPKAPCRSTKTRDMTKHGKRIWTQKQRDVSICRIMFLHSVLGLLPNTPEDKRPCIDLVEAFLKDVAQDSARRLDACIASHYQVFVFAMREFMCCELEYSPVTIDILKQTFNLQGFHFITTTFMNIVRNTVDQAWKDSDGNMSKVYQSFDHADINKAYHHCHLVVLSVGYQRHRQSLRSVLHTCIRGRSGKFVPPVADPSTNRHDEGLPIETLEFLERWMSKLDPCRHSLKRDIWPWLKEIGACPNELKILGNICDKFDNERMGKRVLKMALENSMARNPRTFMLVQTTCAMWARRCMVNTHTLPSNIVENQVRALQERFGMEWKAGEEAPLADHRVKFHYCRCCMTVYSLLRPDGPTATPETLLRFSAAIVRNSAQAKVQSRLLVERYGFFNARRDVATEKMYCRNNRTSGHLSCTNQPLEEVVLIGNVLELGNRKCIMLCPQEKCGIAMEVNPILNGYSQRGPQCYRCAVKQTAKKLKHILEDNLVEAGASFKCYACGASCGQSRAHVYDHGVFLCSLHHSKRAMNYIKQCNPATKEELCAAIRAHYKQITEEKQRYTNQSRHRHELVRFKRASRSRQVNKYY